MSRCRACGADGLQVFHEVESVPVHNSLVVATREQALAVGTGNLRIALCPACGLVQNVAFEESLLAYGAGYEDSQAASGRFAEFVAELVEGLQARHGLAGADVLEVGCGKGDVLAALCRATGGRGLGYDPAYAPGRLEGEGEAWEVRTRRFSEADAAAGADLVVCRHTLEHVPDVDRLMGLLAAATAVRPGAVAYVEVPDVLRVLREGAFWDLYYEHCSYFTVGSLARLADRCGLAVDRLEVVFDGQYLALEASAGRGPLPAAAADLDDLAAAVEGFTTSYATSLGRIRDLVEPVLDRGDEVVLWGASSKAVGLLTALAVGGPGSPAVTRLVDINPHKVGRHLGGTGQEIVAPSALAGAPPALVLVMNPVYREEIGADLRRLGVRSRVEAL